MNYHAPLNSCHISCPWINCASMFMGLKLSSYLVIFQPIIMKFCSLVSFFHFLWDSIYIYFSTLKVTSKLSGAQLFFFPHSLHFYFTCLYLTYSIFFSFMNIRINDVVSILMSFSANYEIYILLLFLLIDFSLVMDIFLLLYTSGYFPFKFIYLS